MEMNEYQYKSGGYRMTTADLTYALLGLSGEVGELNGYVAKLIRDGGRADTVHIAKELGDILWFVSAIAADYGLTLDEVAHKNLDKLSGRKERGTITGSGDNR
jgi:NTP pyrophosphatase (non-canonical NTP hydrolase)